MFSIYCVLCIAEGDHDWTMIKGCSQGDSGMSTKFLPLKVWLVVLVGNQSRYWPVVVIPILFLDGTVWQIASNGK